MDSFHDNSIGASNVFSNPYARRIVQILGRKGWASVKELQDTLKVSSETLHQQLASLEGLVVRVTGQRYRLTREGEIVASSLRLRGSSSRGAVQGRREGGPRIVLKELLFGRSLLNYLNSNRLTGVLLAMIIVSIGGLVSFMTNLEPILLFYINPRPGIAQAWFILLFPVGWLITYGVADLLSYFFFHKRGGDMSLVSGSAIAMLPLLLVPALVFLIHPVSTIIQSATTLTILIQVAVQVWVVCLLSNAISKSKHLPIERTALISLTVMYLNVIAVFVALQLGLF